MTLSFFFFSCPVEQGTLKGIAGCSELCAQATESGSICVRAVSGPSWEDAMGAGTWDAATVPGATGAQGRLAFQGQATSLLWPRSAGVRHTPK